MINLKIFTEDEKAILRSLPSPLKWIARDRYGWLFVYEDEPKKGEDEFVCRDSNMPTKYASLALFKNIFKDVTFENSPILFREPVLDSVERRYLKAVFSPFRNRIVSVRKMDLDLDLDRPNQRIIAMMDNRTWMWYFPPFEAETMYKGMTVNREYSLADLGIKYD